MALQYSDAVRDAQNNAIETTIGAAPILEIRNRITASGLCDSRQRNITRFDDVAIGLDRSFVGRCRVKTWNMGRHERKRERCSRTLPDQRQRWDDMPRTRHSHRDRWRR